MAFYPDSGSIYSQYDWGAIAAQLANVGINIANGVVGNPSLNPPNLYPIAAYGPYNNPYNIGYSPAGAYGISGGQYNRGFTPNIMRGMFDTYNQSPFSGSSGILVLGLVLVAAIVLIKV